MDKDTQSVGMFNRHDLYQSMFDEIEGSSKKKPPRRDSCENRTSRGKDKSLKLNGGTPGTLIEEKSKHS